MFSTSIMGTPAGDVKSSSLDEFKKRKEDKRRSKFNKATKCAAAQKSTNDLVKVQVGLVSSIPDSDILKKV